MSNQKVITTHLLDTGYFVRCESRIRNLEQKLNVPRDIAINFQNDVTIQILKSVAAYSVSKVENAKDNFCEKIPDLIQTHFGITDDGTAEYKFLRIMCIGTIDDMQEVLGVN